MHNSLYALLKSKYVAAYLLHAQRICEANMSSVVNEKVVDKETDTMEYKSVEGMRTRGIHNEMPYFCSRGGRVEDTIL